MAIVKRQQQQQPQQPQQNTQTAIETFDGKLSEFLSKVISDPYVKDRSSTAKILLEAGSLQPAKVAGCTITQSSSFVFTLTKTQGKTERKLVFDLNQGRASGNLSLKPDVLLRDLRKLSGSIEPLIDLQLKISEQLSIFCWVRFLESSSVELDSDRKFAVKLSSLDKSAIAGWQWLYLEQLTNSWVELSTSRKYKNYLKG